MNELTKYLVEELVKEDKRVDKIVVVYSGRFQPFHTGHYDSYQYLVNKFGKDNVFIGTSNKTDNDKSPLNFNEKLKVMQTMFGIPKSKVVMLKNPYRPIELLSKYNSETTALVTVVGEKDSDRLGGKYFQKWNDRLLQNGELVGYLERGYVFVTPSQSGGISGTQVRNGLSTGDEGDKMAFFKKVYGKFDRGIFNLITKKLNTENIIITKNTIEDWLINEASFNDFNIVEDDGRSVFIGYAAHKKISAIRARKIGYKLVSMILSGEVEDITDYDIYPSGPVSAVSFYPAGVLGKQTVSNQVDIYSGKAYDSWYKHIVKVATHAGYNIVKHASAIDDLEDVDDISTSGLDTLPKINESIYFPFEIGNEVMINNKKTLIKTISFTNNNIPIVNGKIVESIKYKNGEFLMKIREIMLNEIPMADLKKINNFADKTLEPADIVITDKHFLDRLVDPRNLKPISSAELIGFFKRLARHKNKFLEFLKKYKEIVVKDRLTKLNIPFMRKANRIIAKTIMRKDDFKTSSPELNFEIVELVKNILNEAGQGGVTAASLKKYYTAVCKSEGVEPLPLKFERVKFGGAATTYNIITMKPLYISFDLNTMYDPEYAVLHELTHQIKLLTEKDAYTGKRDQLAKFKKLENRLIDKYMYSKYSSLLYPKSK
jgi:nicotinic acid mononucleotide adenylyltransferase